MSVSTNKCVAALGHRDGSAEGAKGPGEVTHSVGETVIRSLIVSWIVRQATIEFLARFIAGQGFLEGSSLTTRKHRLEQGAQISAT